MLKLDMHEGEAVFADLSESAVELDVGVGERGPLRGWTFPKYREWVPVSTVQLHSVGRDQMLVSMLSVNGGRVTGVEACDGGVGDEVVLRYEEDGRRWQVSALPISDGCVDIRCATI